MDIAELIAQWDSNEGKPFKGSLIDADAYKANPDSPSCMCAQGQALHYIGGRSIEWLQNVEQSEADAETAKLLVISRAHAVLLRSVNDSVDGAPSVVLTHPEKVLGDQAHTVLAFWRHLDTMTADQWAAAWDAARAAAWDAAWAAARDAARDAAWDAARATNEIQGASVMRANGTPFYFLPMFGFANPEAIPA